MNAIEVRNISKKFRVYHDKSVTLKERLLFFKRTKYDEHQVLKDISINIEKGTTIGLIGQNGSGKSTLLKLLTGIIYPDNGSIKINGKVSSLLELGSGFHPDFSGRENIYNYASIFGLSKAEIDKRYNQIVDFSELHEFIDNPIRTYSSGMYMRLAFSVAINVDADILLIDEILAVGDANFQKKCNDKIKELKMQGVTIVLVTHDIGAVERICDTAVWLENGVIKGFGMPRKVIDEYLLFMGEANVKKLDSSESPEHEIVLELAEQKSETETNINKDVNRWGNRHIEISEVRMINKDKLRKHLFNYGEEVEIQIDYKINRKVDDIVFGIGIFTRDRKECYGTNTFSDRIEVNNIKPQGTVSVLIPKLELVNGSYCLDVAVHAKDGLPYDYQISRYSFDLISNVTNSGVYRPEHYWTFK